jgi:hypothetical protein
MTSNVGAQIKGEILRLLKTAGMLIGGFEILAVIGFFAVLAIASASLAIAPAIASKPVPRTIAGCVFNGTFISADGYDIHPRHADGREVDLRPFEGRTVTISGALLPGDELIVNKPPRASGPCEMMRPAGK